jgi:hypothetical protein
LGNQKERGREYYLLDSEIFEPFVVSLQQRENRGDMKNMAFSTQDTMGFI